MKYINTSLCVFSLIALLIITGCKKTATETPEHVQAVIFTSSVQFTNDTSVVFAGIAAPKAISPILSKGFCWDTLPGPTILHNKTTENNLAGNFTSSVNGLKFDKTYYARAYVTKGTGTYYGEQLSFKTPGLWKKIALPNNNEVTSMIGTGASLFAGTDHGVLLSTDSGATWASANLYNTIVCMAMFKNQVYACTGGGIFRSGNNGATWEQVSTAGYIGDMAATDNLICVTTAFGPLQSADGVTWAPFEKISFLDPTERCSHVAASGNTIYLASPLNPSLFETSERRLFKSVNGGRNWVIKKLPSTTSYLTDLVIMNNKVLIATSGSAYTVPDNSSEWVVEPGFDDFTYTISGYGSTLFATSIYFNGHKMKLSYDNGTNWTVITKRGMAPPLYYSRFVHVSERFLFAQSGGSFYRKSKPAIN